MHFSGFIKNDDMLSLVATRDSGSFLPVESFPPCLSDLENDTGNNAAASFSNVENSAAA
jgi:hypothetical protein